MIRFLFMLLFAVDIGNAAVYGDETNQLCEFGISNDTMTCEDFLDKLPTSLHPSNCHERCLENNTSLWISYEGGSQSCDVAVRNFGVVMKLQLRHRGGKFTHMMTIYENSTAECNTEIQDTEKLCRYYHETQDKHKHNNDGEEQAEHEPTDGDKIDGDIYIYKQPISDDVTDEIDFIFQTHFPEKQILDNKDGCYTFHKDKRTVTLNVTRTNVGIANTPEEIKATFKIQLKKFIETFRPEKKIGWNSYDIISPISSVSMTYTLMYRNNKLQGPKGYLNISTRSISYSVYNHNPLYFVVDVEYRCGYLLPNRSASIDGVHQTLHDDGTIECKSDKSRHLLLFARSQVLFFGSTLWFLILSISFASLTCVSLVITVFTLIWLRKQINNSRTKIQIGLSTSLLFLFVLSMFSMFVPQHGLSCQVLAYSLHYSVLSTGFWMLLEAIILARKTSRKALRLNNSKLVNSVGLHLFIACFIPFLIVAVAVIAGFIYGGYLEKFVTDEYKICFVRKKFSLYFVAIPLLIIVAINLLIVVKVTWHVHKLSKKSGQTLSHYTQLKASLKALVWLIPCLGITWLPFLIGEFTGLENYFEFWLLDALINHLQGFMIFLFYCVFSHDVRSALRAKIQRKRASNVNNSSGASNHLV